MRGSGHVATDSPPGSVRVVWLRGADFAAGSPSSPDCSVPSSLLRTLPHLTRPMPTLRCPDAPPSSRNRPAPICRGAASCSPMKLYLDGPLFTTPERTWNEALAARLEATESRGLRPPPPPGRGQDPRGDLPQRRDRKGHRRLSGEPLTLLAGRMRRALRQSICPDSPDPANLCRPWRRGVDLEPPPEADPTLTNSLPVIKARREYRRRYRLETRWQCHQDGHAPRGVHIGTGGHRVGRRALTVDPTSATSRHCGTERPVRTSTLCAPSSGH